MTVGEDELTMRLKPGEALGDRVMKVDHAGEHGAICIYIAQIRLARWTAPEAVPELRQFLEHERRHRALFAAELQRRNMKRCRGYWLCGGGGFILGGITGLMGRKAIAATTLAVESVVLVHLQQQMAELQSIDPSAVATLMDIIDDEQTHHDLAVEQVGSSNLWCKLLTPMVALSTGAVIWLGMNL